MRFTEKLKEGLKRELTVIYSEEDLNAELTSRIVEAKSTMKLNGFRPGKVPESFLRKNYGKSFMAQIVNDKISELPSKIVAERGEKIASRPEINLNEDDKNVNAVLEGKAPLEVNVKYEVLPEIEIKDFSKYEIERQIADIPQEEVTKQVEQLLSSTRDFTEKKTASKDGDRITIDYVGKIDGVAFDNGSDKDAQLIIGSKNFIPSFEEQLIGLKAGDSKVINVRFPDEYDASDLAGKDATFDIEVKKVEKASPLKIDDEQAQKLGVESLAKLEEFIKEQLESRYGSFTRQKVKRQILDILANEYDFDVPQSLVNAEYENLQAQLKQYSNDVTEEDKQEYKDLAIRRVRLGLLLANIGESAKIDVTKDELQRAMYQQLQNFPGREKEIAKIFQTNPEALASLRAPIFEDKVVDYILDKVKVNDKIVSIEDLIKEGDESDSKSEEKPKKTSKKPRAKKTEEASYSEETVIKSEKTDK